MTEPEFDPELVKKAEEAARRARKSGGDVYEIVEVVLEVIAEDLRAEGRKQAAEDFLSYDDECGEHEAAGDYMQIRFGGDTEREEDWTEAYRIARQISRPNGDNA